MIRKHDEDLFKDTTMTFGEHLEELRGCLWKAVMGIAIGFVIGLLVANQVVHAIKLPLERALASYYRTDTINKYQTELAKLVAEKSRGLTLPYTLDEVTRLVEEDGLLFEIYWVSSAELNRALNPASKNAARGEEPAEVPAEATEVPPEPKEAAKSPSNAPTADAPVKKAGIELQPLFLWHRIDDDQRIRLIGLNTQEAFMIWIKAGLIVGLVLASPWVFWQLWAFVAAGLYPHEKRYVHVFLPFSLGLFLLGASTAFLFVFDPVLKFLLSFNRTMGVDPDPRISEWLGFVLLLPLGFGVSFQLPLVMLFLERIGVFDVPAYLEKWRIAILVIFVLSMVISPGGDPYSMLLMAIPLTFLYFGGILLCKYLPKGRSPFDEPA
jgi:sec-independent protein translocase protein TatC